MVLAAASPATLGGGNARARSSGQNFSANPSNVSPRRPPSRSCAGLHLAVARRHASTNCSTIAGFWVSAGRHRSVGLHELACRFRFAANASVAHVSRYVASIATIPAGHNICRGSLFARCASSFRNAQILTRIVGPLARSFPLAVNLRKKDPARSLAKSDDSNATGSSIPAP